MLPEVDRACGLIVAAATQLTFSVRSPMLTAITVGMQVKLFYYIVTAFLDSCIVLALVGLSIARCSKRKCGRGMQRGWTTGRLFSADPHLSLTALRASMSRTSLVPAASIHQSWVSVTTSLVEKLVN